MDTARSEHPFAINGEEFSLAPFDTFLQPLIRDALAELDKDKYRRGTFLTPTLLVWLVLALTLRRDLSYDKVLNWLGSGLRWVADQLPARHKLVSDGAISRARRKLGWAVFQRLWTKLIQTLPPVPADFHGYSSVIFDGSTGTLPDTPENQAEFGQPRAREGGSAAFPQVRLMALLAVSARRLVAVAQAPYTGKGTGERALRRQILSHFNCQRHLFLLDAGLYALELLWDIAQRGGVFLVKVPATVQFRRTERVADGSWLAEISGKHSTQPPRPVPRVAAAGSRSHCPCGSSAWPGPGFAPFG